MRFIIYIVFFLLTSCGGISFLNGNPAKLYTDPFLQKIESIKRVYNSGERDQAIAQINGIVNSELLPTERALAYNLTGVIYFSKEEFKNAIDYFNRALTTSHLDKQLTAQIYFNLSSAHFKIDQLDQAYSYGKQCQWRTLGELDKKNFHRLMAEIANLRGDANLEVTSILYFLADKKNILEIKSSSLFDDLSRTFFSLEKRQRLQILDQFEDSLYLSVGFLAYLQYERFLFNGESVEAKELSSWIESKTDNEEILALIGQTAIENFASEKIDPYSIGVVLPLSGSRAEFSSRALEGIDSALQKISREITGAVEEGTAAPTFKLFVEDSKGNGQIGAQKIKELVRRHHVSAVIGGLFSDEAKEEFLEAKKQQALFVSLSEIYLPRKYKNEMLIEIPGSIESQIHSVLSDEAIRYLGKRVSILYPKTSGGHAVTEEFWRAAKDKNIEVTGAYSFDVDQTDFRDPVMNLLGLKYKRVRQEELDLLTEVYSLEKRRGARRVQTLAPQIDYDWIFLPTYPNVALQLIPSFSYFDAFRQRIVGGPSWRSRSLVEDGHSLAHLHFVGDTVNQNLGDFTSTFVSDYKRKPMLIELRAYDSFKLIADSIRAGNFSNRKSYMDQLKSMEGLTGITGEWKFREGLWMKNMELFRIKRSLINPVDLENLPNEEANEKAQETEVTGES